MAVTKGDQFTIAIRPSQLINLLAILLNTFTCRGRTERGLFNYFAVVAFVGETERTASISQIGIITVIIRLITESNYDNWRVSLEELYISDGLLLKAHKTLLQKEGTFRYLHLVTLNFQ